MKKPICETCNKPMKLKNTILGAVLKTVLSHPHCERNEQYVHLIFECCDNYKVIKQ